MPAPDSLHGAQQFSSRHQPCPLPFSPDQSGPHGPCLRNPDYLAFQPYLVLPLTFTGRWKRRVLARVASSLPASVWVRAAPFLLCGGRWSWPGALWVSPVTIGIGCVFGLSLFACFSLECGNRFISSRRELVPLTRALLLILHFFLHSQVSKG